MANIGNTSEHPNNEQGRTRPNEEMDLAVAIAQAIWGSKEPSPSRGVKSMVKVLLMNLPKHVWIWPGQ